MHKALLGASIDVAAEGGQLMRLWFRSILVAVMLLGLSGCVTPYRAKQDDLLQQNEYGREAVEYYRVKLSIPF
jgi:hypothetical protein